MSFTHLHLHTSYSLLDGSGRIPEMVARAKELGQNALAITDHGVMYGCIEFYKECKKQGIKPILGCEVYITTGSRFDREYIKGEDKYNHLILLAKNEVGYHNLIKIVSLGFIDGYYYKPRIDYEILNKYSEGLISLSACIAGEIPKYILQDKYDKALQTAKNLESIFGRGNFYLELQNHGYDTQKKVNIALLKMSKELGIDLVATNDVHYTYKEDMEAHDALLCIQTGKKVTDENRLRYEGGQFYIKSEDEMLSLFPYAKEAISNTQKIVDSCNVEILFTSQTHKYHLPIFNPPGDVTAVDYLFELSNNGLRKRYKRVDEVLRRRLEYELNTIVNMGFVDYFLIVQDYINYAKNNGIPVGPGRGSAAGSLVAYTLGITDVDPIKYNLLFERFLNPERVTMPDIDIDFCEKRREEVINYVRNKYGQNNVSQIVTFGTLKAKAVFKDIARVLDIPYTKSNNLSKLIPNRYKGSYNVSYDDILNADIQDFDSREQLKVIQFRQMYLEDADIKRVVDLAKRLEGIPRHASMHASGILIAPSPIYDYVTLVRLNDDGGQTSLVAGENMTTIEQLGLLKMDFLGLRNLTAIYEALNIIQEKYNIKIDFTKCDYNDKKVFELIAKGQTVGIFQLESPGMTSFMKELKPNSLEDIIAGISLYRPGPMDFIPKYIEGKKNKSKIQYDCNELKPILSSTYGCIVYQEQVMQIFRTLAGYSFGAADLVRRAMAKKHSDELEKERKAFIYGDPNRNIRGCIKNGIDEKIANKIFEDVLGFASYAFNKSHAAAYAHVAYQTAFLKCYYPLEFICALCNSVIDSRENLFEYISYAQSINIKVLPVDVNISSINYIPHDNGILMGFAALKGVANNLSEIIIEDRELNGQFKSFYDFIVRLKNKGINKTAIEALIYAGAFDQFYGNRKQKITIYPLILKSDNRYSVIDGQISLVDMLSDNIVDVNALKDEQILANFSDLVEYDKDELLQKEKEITGLYLTEHPLADYSKIIHKITNVNTKNFYYDEENEISKIQIFKDRNITLKMAALCTNIETKLTKKAEEMAVLTLEDEYSNIEGIVFPQAFSKYKHLINKNEKLYIEGKADVVENDKSKILIDKIELLKNIKNILIINFLDASNYKQKYDILMKILENNKGDEEVIIKINKEKLQKLLDIKIKITNKLLDELKENDINAE